MSIQKRGKRFQANVYDGPGKRLVKTFRTQGEAQEWEAKKKLERRMPGGEMTVQAFAETWLERYPRPKRSTEVHYAQAIKGFVKQYGSWKLRDLDRAEMRRWAIDHGAAAGTARAMLGDAFRDDLISRNPLAEMRLPSSRGRKDIEALSEADIQRLADAARKTHGEYGRLVYAPMILLAAYTGLRPGELHGLRWEDIKGDKLKVVRQYSPKANAFTSTKTGASRELWLHPIAQQALQTIPHTALSEVFTTKNGRHFSGRVSHYYWAPVRAAFGDPSLDFYALRHAFGSLLAREGVNAPEIARAMGHADGGALAMRTYIHISEAESQERIRQAFEKPRLRVVGE